MNTRSTLALGTALVFGGCSLDAVGGSNGGGNDASSSIGTGAGGSGPQPSTCGETPNVPDFEIGTGEVCFEPLADGDVVPLIAGQQGGFHVWIALLCAACPDEVHAIVGVKLEEGDAWVGETGERIIELRSEQFAGLYALLAGTTDDPSSVLPEGTAIRMVVELRSLEGEALFEGEKHVTLGPTEVWHNVCDPDETTCGKPDGALKCCS